jgi:ABC-type nitrate/sulfonate/bicarbonate transport system substrate-binding protein
MVEGAGRDVIIVMGGDASMNEFMVRPEIGGFADIRGKVVAVDAPNTAYALVAKKILKNNGLIEGRDYTVRPVGGTAQRSAAMASNPELVAGIVNLPFSITVREKGLKSLGRSRDLVGAYQATGAFVMRPWAQANGDVLERYITAYVESSRVAMDPANRAAGAAALATRFKLDPKVAAETIEQLMIPGFGLAPDARFDMDGFRTVLALRAEIEGQWGGKPPGPGKYVDLGYYERALKRLGAN